MTKILLAALAFGASVAIADPVLAEKLKATLDGKSEVPPNSSKAAGTAELDYDPASRELSWKVTYSGLSGPPVAAHFHGPAKPDKTGSVAVKMDGAGPSPFAGSAMLTDAQAADLLAGRYYINIHTAKHPSGEIRGQVTRQ
ncbi:MAG: CHRD domain-containing protein [Bradyrhizobium sp.]|uniref:CHRD domain-containing protein n=1 Tax=Bradyrhizobium sp. TaxID=376 RepID=UPI003D0BEFE4